MNPIFTAALEIQEFCRARGFRFCFIDGLALQRWGEARLTQDVALGAMPFEERAVSRSSPFLVAEGISPLTCSDEDLIVFKAFAGRAQDWIDIEGIALRQHRRLDGGLIWQELNPLLELKEDEQTGPRLRRLLEHPAT